MFNYQHYVPILRSKRAELVALRQLSDEAKKKLTPLISVIPIPWDHKTDKPKKTLREHIEYTSENIVKAWPSNMPIFLDSTYAISTTDTVSGEHPLVFLGNMLNHAKVKMIPVVGLESDINFYTSIKKINIKNKVGFCLRIQQDDFDYNNIETSINDVLKKCGVSPPNIDVILDFESLPIKATSNQAVYLLKIIRNFPHISEWRTFTFAASSFPLFLTELKADSTKLLPREEYYLWKEIIMNGHTLLPRLPSYGDYAIQHPEISDIDFSNKKISVNLRYTTQSHYLIFKGREKNRYGHAQFNKICGELVKRKDYFEPNYSEGDNYIDRCSKNVDGPGTPEIWRRAGFNHHLTFVGDQIANFVVS